ncbi:unnamed protein product [Nesidiocoris tenuis]|uniref:Uncharacterized protein n=1 Tax=Nesidiocoris tenuis TaxID=355587 RepID=A0A6H5GAY6_9HEMI|nr:unnamed protein product [Nesidiocoris tenuis]
MGNPGPVEDILSDEYEEGEIRDDDILFDNVSSLEEISDQEFVEIDPPSKESRKSRSQRKKDHKCKEDSLCRKERNGKHCYARIRKTDVERSTSKSSNNAHQFAPIKSRAEKPSERLAPSSRAHPQRRGSLCRADIPKKSNPRRRQPAYYNRKEPVRSLKKVSLNRRNKGRVGTPFVERGYHRKQRSRSASPIKMKYDSNRVMAKSSLLDRLVGSGSMPWKNQSGCDSDDTTSKVINSGESGDDLCRQSQIDHRVENRDFLDNSSQLRNRTEIPGRESSLLLEEVDTKDITVSPKASQPLHEPQKEDIDEVELRVYALKTAIMKKYSVLNRKKNLARLKKTKQVDPNDDSFRELALMDIGSDSSSPQPPGVDDVVMDLSSDRGSQDSPSWGRNSEEGFLNEAIIVDISKVVDRSPSGNQLPCCLGKPIPVISPHRPSRDDRSRNPLALGNIHPLPMEMSTPSSVLIGTPKYLKEINSNRKGSEKKKLLKGSAKRPNTVRQRTLSVPRRTDLPKDRSAKRARPEIDEDEDELRKLALMSVKRKHSISEGMLAQVDVNPLTVQTGQPDLAKSEELPEKSHPPDETWENLDEDILRAQLLSSLSQKLISVPENPLPPESRFFPDNIISKRRLVRKTSTVRKQVITKKLNKENVYSKRNFNLQTSKPLRNVNKYVNPNFFSSQSMNSPIVDKFVIRLSSSESSEDEPIAVPGNVSGHCDVSNGGQILNESDIELKIDRLLETTRKETELIQKASMYYPLYQVSSEISQNAAVEQEIFGLTSWQQEEFERQKKARTIKQNLMKIARKKVKTKCTKEPESQSTKEDVGRKSVVKLSNPSLPCAERQSSKVQVPSISEPDKNGQRILQNKACAAPKLDAAVATSHDGELGEELKMCNSRPSDSSIKSSDVLDDPAPISKFDEIKPILDGLVERVCSNLNMQADSQLTGDSAEGIQGESISPFEDANLITDVVDPNETEGKSKAANGSQISTPCEPTTSGQSKFQREPSDAPESLQIGELPKNAAPIKQKAMPVKDEKKLTSSGNDSPVHSWAAHSNPYQTTIRRLTCLIRWLHTGQRPRCLKVFELQV